jgi:hypothetical protein
MPEQKLPLSRQSMLRRLGKWFAIGLLALAVLLGFLPQILGSKWLYQKLVDRLAVQGFRLRIDDAEFGWLKPIAVRGIRLEQVDAPEDESQERAQNKRLDLLSIDAIESNRSLLGYLLHGRDLGKITIHQPRLDIELLENTSNLEKLARSIENSEFKPDSNASKRPPKIDVEIAIEGLSVSVQSPDDRGGTDSTVLVVPPLNVNAKYVSLDGASRIEIGSSTLLDQVAITPELVRLGLVRAIPLLANSASFDGKVSLHVDDTVIPLDHPELMKGRAQLTLHQVRSSPSEPVVINVLDMIARFRKKEPAHELVFVDGSVVQVTAHDGRIEHRGVQIGLPRIDPRLQLTSAGTVGILDRTIDIGVGIPVPLELLARRESVQSLGIPQITLPIRGTLDSPFLDWKEFRGESADLLALISAALGDEAPGTASALDALSGITEGKTDQAIGAAIDVIRELRQRRQERLKQAAEKDAELVPIDNSNGQKSDRGNENSGSRRPLRDALKGLLNGRDRNP